MSFFEFPHTRTYDSDLGWLIKTVSQIGNEYQSLVDYMNRHEVEYEELERRMTALESEIDSFELQIDRRFASLEQELSNEIASQIAVGLREIDAAIAQIDVAIGEMRAALVEIRSEIARAMTELTAEVKGYYDLSKLYTDAKIQELINSLPDLTTVNVFNPVRGEITNIQTAVNDLYDLARVDALMAIEYDTMGLTADEYDSLELTALQYDIYGKYYMQVNGYFIDSLHYMTSPFTGETVLLQTVINELVSLHKDDTLTAAEYDALDLDASYYDGLDLTAFDYDWHGKTLVA